MANAASYARTAPRTGNALFDSMDRPEYTAAYDPLNMSMSGNMAGLMGTYGAGYKQFKDEATRQGPSSWLRQAEARNDLQEVDQREKMGAGIESANAGAMDKLASSGGLSSGARERVAEGGAKNYIDMSQNMQREGNLNDMTMGMQDESNRISQLGQLQGMEQGLINTWQTAKGQDVQNQMGETKRLDDYNMNLYQQMMQAAAAERQAQAQENSRPRDKFLGIF